MKTNLIKINNQPLEVKFDAAALYRYSKEGGGRSFLEGKSVADEKVFFTIILFVWSMLKGKDKARYKNPEDLSFLFLPLPTENFINEVYAIVEKDLQALLQNASK